MPSALQEGYRFPASSSVWFPRGQVPVVSPAELIWGGQGEKLGRCALCSSRTRPPEAAAGSGPPTLSQFLVAMRVWTGLPWAQGCHSRGQALRSQRVVGQALWPLQWGPGEGQALGPRPAGVLGTGLTRAQPPAALLFLLLLPPGQLLHLVGRRPQGQTAGLRQVHRGGRAGPRAYTGKAPVRMRPAHAPPPPPGKGLVPKMLLTQKCPGTTILTQRFSGCVLRNARVPTDVNTYFEYVCLCVLGAGQESLGFKQSFLYCMISQS